MIDLRHRQILALGVALSAALTLASQLPAATYTQNFNGFADGTADVGDGSQMNGNASIQRGKLRLTEDLGAGGFSSFNIPALADSSLGWTATFEVTIIDSVANNDPADGMSFNYGNFGIGELGGAEEGMHGNGVVAVTENLSFEIDTWQNLDTEQGVNIAEAAGGVDNNLAFTNGQILSDGTSVIGSVTMSWDPTNGATFTTTGLLTNADFVNIPTTFAASDALLFGLSARVGGANETVLIDNLAIRTGALGDPDSDGDGLSDIYELAHGLDPDDNGENPNNNGVAGDPDQGASGDPDMDTLTNIEERDLGTYPQEADSDSDGLDDNFENNNGTWGDVLATGTDPLRPDTDGDGLLDGVENPDLPYDSLNPATQPGTDPNLFDTDGDLVGDGDEVAAGRNPTVADVAPTGYSQDFDSFPDGTTNLGDGTQMNGNASVQGGQLRLTQDGGASGFSSFNIPALADSSLGWTASFDLTIIDSVGNNEPADGMSFNYGNFGLGLLGGAEEGMQGNGNVASATENLSFEIDTWMNLDTEQGVNIAQSTGGAETIPDLAFTNGSILADGTTVTGNATMSWSPTKGASFATTGLVTNANFVDVPTTFAASDAFLFGFSGRVGGANETVLIDNVVIQTGAVVDNFRILSIEKVIVPGAGGDPDTISLTVTWNSQESKVYGIYAAGDLPDDILNWEELDDSFPGAAGQETTSFTEQGIPIDTLRRFYQVRDTTSR